MRKAIFSLSIVLISLILCSGWASTESYSQEAYGVVTRTLPVRGKVVVTPIFRNFSNHSDVRFFDSDGTFICQGKVVKAYADLVYISLPEQEMEKLRKGFLVSHEGIREKEASLSRFSMNISMVIENSVRNGQKVPPNEILLEYINKDGKALFFHHYNHRFRCTNCHHSHDDAIDRACRSCHESETAWKLFGKDDPLFPERVKGKCMECHSGQSALYAGLTFN